MVRYVIGDPGGDHRSPPGSRCGSRWGYRWRSRCQVAETGPCTSALVGSTLWTGGILLGAQARRQLIPSPWGVAPLTWISPLVREGEWEEPNRGRPRSEEDESKKLKKMIKKNKMMGMMFNTLIDSLKSFQDKKQLIKQRK